MAGLGGKELGARQEGAIGAMFSAIAPRYDALNRLLSLRRDVAWRRAAIASLQCRPGERLLDVATGTADMLLEAAAQCGAGVELHGVDLSGAMLERARRKLRKPGRRVPAALLAGSGVALPYRAEEFDAVCIAFGIRNVADRAGALAEMGRVLRPGGRLAVLEFASETEPVLGGLYGWYLRHVLLRLGGFISGNRDAYRYLHDSVLRFPPTPAFRRLIEAVGFAQVRVMPLTFGIANLFTARKP
ncbi:MAG: bifunctional demethylmenaquinone methyltransferase/2-methoxy-6-polyprenyl-1,4-benzoquinol methylase UbiE [Candidatus Tectomicrobia bacterium]|nr:bifunctional demethylmenaquinone methyltransferase/2-methoxy-6-polyprenyl-1,4-benzoquinol methylase UbiE [Candidatus Tectomicrobia bacterium]